MKGHAIPATFSCLSLAVSEVACLDGGLPGTSYDPGHRHKIGHLRLLPGPSRNLTPPSKQARDIYFEHICIHIPTLHET